MSKPKKARPKKNPLATILPGQAATAATLAARKWQLSERWWWPWRKACKVKILIVMEGPLLTFGPSYFGLSAVLDTLANDPHSWVKFDVTRAHRQSPLSGPVDMPDFRFDGPGVKADFDIDDYDQIWFFGWREESTGGTAYLTDGELDKLVPWMEAGGGVFAVGDHATIGAALCSRIPRVRSMRKWTAADQVPPFAGPTRHDTLLKGHDSVYTFDDESDDIPMKLRVRRYPLPSSYPVPWWFKRYAPHPLLCGRAGVINRFPDHPHEGEVRGHAQIALDAPLDPNQPEGAKEFPNATSGGPKPEIIAWARVQADHTPSDFKGEVNAKEFGAVGAYDGHRASVGRVVVDSTWHHWFDVNLVGRPVGNLDSAPFNASNQKTEGFLATAAGQAALEQIKDYFVNVAVWLAPRTRQRCMYRAAVWGSLFAYPLLEARAGATLTPLQLGAAAKDVIGRAAGRCTMYNWLIPLIPAQLFHPIPIRVPDPLPCLSCPPFELVADMVIGETVASMLPLARAAMKSGKAPSDKALANATAKGVNASLSRLAEWEQARAKGMSTRADKLSGVLKKARRKAADFRDPPSKSS